MADYAAICALDLEAGAPPMVSAGERPMLLLLWRGKRLVARRLLAPGEELALAGVTESPPPPPRPAPPEARLSLVICTRDRAALLDQCLADIARQTRAPDEVIVVDNASRDGAAIEQVVARHGHRYVREPRPGLDFARNLGLASARCDLIGFIDDDTIQREDWVANMIAAFDDPAIWAVTGMVLPATLATRAQYLFERDWSFFRGTERQDFDPAWLKAAEGHGAPTWEIGAGASMAFRREVIARAGWFDERLDAGLTGCGGDSEYWYRIIASGGTCRYEPSVVSYHYHRESERAFERQIGDYMMGQTVALLVQHRRWGHRGNARRALHYLPRYLARATLAAARRGDRDELRRLVKQFGGVLRGYRYYLAHRGNVAADGRLAAPVAPQHG